MVTLIQRDKSEPAGRLWSGTLCAIKELMSLTGLEPRMISPPPNTVTPYGREKDEAEFSRRCLGFSPGALQAEVLRSHAKRVILNCSRQWGKSTVTAAKALYRASSRDDCLVLVASPSRRQSAEWMRKAKRMALHMGIVPCGDGDNEVSLKLGNGSRIVGLPGVPDTTRGFSAVSMLVIDEAARVSDEMYYSLRPMLAVSDGDIWMMSTPHGKSGFFYETWEFGGTEWWRMRGLATECPQIPAAFLEEERRAMNADTFRQEHMCEFVGQGTSVFDRALVERMLDDDIKPFDL